MTKKEKIDRILYESHLVINGSTGTDIKKASREDANIIHHYKQHSNLLILDRFYSEKYEALLEVSKAEIGIIDVKDILLEVRRRKLEFSKEKIRIKEHLDNL